MDINSILEVQKINILRNTRRVSEKLFLLHKTKKLSNEEFLKKMEKLRALFNRAIDDLINLEKLMEARIRKDHLTFFIIEHFNHIGCYETATKIAEKYGMEDCNDKELFSRINKIKEDLFNSKFGSSIELLKEYKTAAKYCVSPNIENKIKIKMFLDLCQNKDLVEAIKYCNLEFKKTPSVIKKYLPLLIKTSVDVSGYDHDFKTITNEVYVALLDIFKLHTSSRLQRRVEYAFMTCKVEECMNSQNKKCPTCCSIFKLRNDVPFNHKDRSIVLCKGSGEEVDDQNQPYVFSDGNVYGLNYLKKSYSSLEYAKNKNKSSVYPRLCYFV